MSPRTWCMDRMFELVILKTVLKLDSFLFAVRQLHSYRISPRFEMVY